MTSIQYLSKPQKKINIKFVKFSLFKYLFTNTYSSTDNPCLNYILLEIDRKRLYSDR